MIAFRKMLAYRKKTGWYVAQLPGQGGVDWGYTSNPGSPLDPAIELSDYWQRRFAADCRRCNDEAIFVPKTERK